MDENKQRIVAQRKEVVLQLLEKIKSQVELIPQDDVLTMTTVMIDLNGLSDNLKFLEK